MKKLTFLLIASFLLSSCRKHAVDPISTQNDSTLPTPIGLYHQPSKVEITWPTITVKTILSFVYNAEGLVKTIEAYVDSNSISIKKTAQFDFIYMDGKLHTKSTTNYTDPGIYGGRIVNTIENYTYENNRLKTYRLDYDKEIPPYVLNKSLTYFYDSSNHIDYVLSDSNGIEKDSNDYQFIGDTGKINYVTLAFYGKGQGGGSDTLLHGYKSYQYYPGGWSADKNGLNIGCGAPTPCYAGYAFSSLINTFQREVFDIVFSNYGGYLPVSYPEMDELLEKYEFNYDILSGATNRTSYRYDYIVSDDGKLREAKYWFASVASDTAVTKIIQIQY